MDPLAGDAGRSFWYGLINYEQRSPIVADLKLDRMRGLLERLGNPHQRLRLVHIAGTKGKGSTSAMLASVLRQAGYRTGLYTSPHLSRVEERFQVDGQPISVAELNQLLGEVQEAALARPDQLPTFFEVATAVGFLHFLRRRVDFAVLEVGLGGRLDSTNVCLPLVAVITSISSDHVQILGHRLEQIAWEKAGIIKPGRPTISGATNPEARGVIEEICRQRHSPLRQLGVDFSYTYRPGQVSTTAVQLPVVQMTSRQGWPDFELKLLGEHQARNATLVVASVEQLRVAGCPISDAAVVHGLAQVEWPARLEILRMSPLVIVDCSHNVASIQAVIQTLNTSFRVQRRILLFAASSDKDIPGMLRELAPQFQHALLTRFTDSRRALPPDQLAEQWRALSPIPCSVHSTPADAWQEAQRLAGPEDLICITGSIFLAGELRPLILTSA